MNSEFHMNDSWKLREKTLYSASVGDLVANKWSIKGTMTMKQELRVQGEQEHYEP